ncbi:MAG: twin-arginine translocase subunit TatC [Thermomicrobiales bacterium]|nr:twin-arginine translocase subunit TatC [Thermomicrobiales bacterium]
MARFLKAPKLSMPHLPDWNSDEPEVFEEMTLQEHLEEFRDRIIKMIIAIVPAFILGFMIHKRVLEDIREKSNAVEGLQTLSAVDPITISFQISLYIAIAITMPIIVYQIIAFLMPGMTRKEKKFLFSSLPFIAILFISGALFGYFVAAPRALDFLSGWNAGILKWDITAENAVTFFLRLVIGIGIGFQLPVIIFVLTKLGIVKVGQLRKWRKYAYLLLLIAAAIITPTPDPLNMSVVAIPLILLYELGILISAFFGRTIIREPRPGERDETSIVDV